MSYQVQTKVQVRFADVDMMGHANNAHYFTYFEQARLAYFKNFSELDFTLPKAGIGKSVILASISCQYRSPAYLDETLIVKIRTKEIGRSSFTMEYEMMEEKSGRLVATAESVQVYFDYETKKSIEISEELRRKFGKVEGKNYL